MRKLENIATLPGPIFVTGHTGFKGTWLTALLDCLEIPWFGYSLAPEKESLYTQIQEFDPDKEVYGDIRDVEKLKLALSYSQPSAIFHLAAQPLVLKSYLEPKYTFDVNVMGTANVLESANQCTSVKYVVVATTDKVYENSEKGNRFIENDPLGGRDPYSASKAACEMVIEAWRNIPNLNRKMGITAARAGNVIGGGDFSENRLLPDLVKGFYEKRTIKIRNPNSIRPWQHVLDPLFGYLQILNYGLEHTPPRAVNFGPNEGGLTVKEVAYIAKRTWGGSTETVFINENQELHEAKNLELDSNWARNNLLWKSIYNQKEAVESTVNYWKNLKINGVSAKELVNQEIKNCINK